ncbi:hypothetical protein PYW08_009233 [Mythimna loreyi]|uniref:Uncharacterized protein n=1 Tax=Mythimna loreyi TaxID=667449 RepID=A0ACC2Q863_9NEOP|nr:hypothetical protein PYW08_009233 [Mythimna loreyi]
MKSALLVVLLAAAATAAVVGNEVPDVVRVPDIMGLPDAVEEYDMHDGDEVAYAGVYEMPDVFVSDSDELIVEGELPAEAVEPAADTWPIVDQKSISSRSEVRVHNTEYRANGVPGHFWVRDIRVNTNRRISRIRITRLGAAQGASANIIAGGVGSFTVTIRIRSAVGRGYAYRIEIWVR